MKVLIIIAICVGLIVVTLALFLASLFRYGLMYYNVKDWDVPPLDKSLSWDEIFKKARDIKVSVHHSGNVVAQSGSRPYIRNETIPKDYPINSEETLPAIAFSFTHPQNGDILVDTGLNTSFYTNPPYGDLLQIMQAYQKDNNYHYTLDENMNIGSHLQRLGIHPQYVLFTHLHPDHVAGLKEVDNEAVVIINKLENIFYYKMLNGPYLKGKKIRSLDFSKSIQIGPFEQVIDIFGDMSVFAIATPGHTIGHISYLINNKEQPVFIIGDLQVSSRFEKDGIETSVDPKDKGVEPLHRSIKQFEEFMGKYPHVKVLYPHEMPLERQH